ncbi:hypothetical protein J2S74_003750 [Evansella vedderi]|uniref:Uncharacterized protein n=1 Tax=Evansella vedderi TaxID=38282 RepID=A0ABU0A1U9_9BACI|nr:hypothetical protein [Evansella vedderi]MDQ0256330.1 hypothetical protein [Evansella vedderi]
MSKEDKEKRIKYSIWETRTDERQLRTIKKSPKLNGDTTFNTKNK